MKKYFVASDVHSFYTILRKTLDKHDFNYDEDYLVVNGDLFDRGDESVELLKFVKSLGDRFIYVRGNHEDLLEDCLRDIQNGKDLGRHHFHNKTISTIQQFTGIDDYYFYFPTKESKEKVNNIMAPIMDYINKKSVNYFELGPFIITHCWIPCDYRIEGFSYKKPIAVNKKWNVSLETMDENEREIYKNLWKSARWGNPFEHWRANVVPEGKIIVSGHWHCSYGFSRIDMDRKEFPEKNRKDWINSFNIWYRDNFIAIDSCVAYSGKINCIVLEDHGDFIYNKTLNTIYHTNNIIRTPVMIGGTIETTINGENIVDTVDSIEFFEDDYNIHTLSGINLNKKSNFEVLHFV